MSDSDEVTFKVSLNIKSIEESDFGFPNIVLGVTPESGADGGSVQLIRIDASGGFDATDRGALQVASLLTDAAECIKRELSAALLKELNGDAPERGRFTATGQPPVTEYDRLEQTVAEVPARPAFNPKPIGGK